MELKSRQDDREWMMWSWEVIGDQDSMCRSRGGGGGVWGGEHTSSAAEARRAVSQGSLGRQGAVHARATGIRVLAQRRGGATHGSCSDHGVMEARMKSGTSARLVDRALRVRESRGVSQVSLSFVIF